LPPQPAPFDTTSVTTVEEVATLPARGDCSATVPAATFVNSFSTTV